MTTTAKKAAPRKAPAKKTAPAADTSPANDEAPQDEPAPRKVALPTLRQCQDKDSPDFGKTALPGAGIMTGQVLVITPDNGGQWLDESAASSWAKLSPGKPKSGLPEVRQCQDPEDPLCGQSATRGAGRFESAFWVASPEHGAGPMSLDTVENWETLS